MLTRLKDSWRDPARRPTLIVGLGAIILAFVLLIVAAGQINKTPQTVPTVTPDTGCVINCPQSQTSAVPKVLHVRSRAKTLVTVNVTKSGVWTQSADVDKAEWVFGTVVNYVIGLPGSQENKDMLEAMSEADEIALDLSTGQTLNFRYAGRQFVSPGSTDIFLQSRPGLTLVLLGDSTNQRTVVTANYVPDSEVGKSVPNSHAQINTPIELGGVKVTVISARLILNAPGIVQGSAFYMVDFTAENTGADVVDVSNFFIELQDFTKQKYSLSETATALGPNNAPKGQLLPGIAATFTSGFEVPSNVTGPVLFWIFKPTASFKAQADVAVPLIGPTPTPDPRSRLTVQITQAAFSPDQSEMIVVGGIGNPTGVPIVVEAADISLSTPDGVLATINGSEPNLPFNVGPGQTLTFSLRFSRIPGALSAVLKVLSTSFQLQLQ